MKISDLTKLNPIGLQTIDPDSSVHAAVRKLVEHNIGALPVVDGSGSLVGIITERDVLRLMAGDTCADALNGTVGAAMTSDLVIGVPDDDVDYVMRVMTERRIRHFPILDDGKLVGIISIGDLVKAKHDDAETAIRFMRDYMSGQVG